MIISFEELFQQLLQFRRAPASHTKKFRALRHNDDLCPQCEKQLGAVMDSFLKHGKVAYDVQGIHDRGTDVLFRYEEDFEQKFIGLQIKSYDDLRSKTYLKDLKAQRYEASQDLSGSIVHYFVVLCTDLKVDAGKVREIKKAFAGDAGVTVVDPAFALTFFSMAPARIFAVVENFLRKDDIVLAQARESIAGLTPPRAVLLFTLLERHLRQPANDTRIADLQAMPSVLGLYQRLPDLNASAYFGGDDGDVEYGLDDDGELDETTGGANGFAHVFRRDDGRERDLEIRIAEDLEAMERDGVGLDGRNVVSVDPSYYTPLLALMLDATVRYGYTGTDMIEFCFDALGITTNFPQLAALGI